MAGGDIQIKLTDTLDASFGAELTRSLKALKVLTAGIAKDMQVFGTQFQTAMKAASTSTANATKANQAYATSITSVGTKISTLIAKSKNLNTEDARSLKTKSEINSLYKSQASAVLNLKVKMEQLRASIKSSNKSDSEKKALLALLSKEFTRLSSVITTTSGKIKQFNQSQKTLVTNQTRTDIRDLAGASLLLGNRLGSVVSSITLGAAAISSLGPVAAVAIAGFAGLSIGLKATELSFTAFTTAVNAGIAATTDQFASFDLSITAAAVAAGGTGSSFQLLSDIAKETALDFKFSSNEMAGSLLTLSRAGFTVQEQIETLPSVSTLAAGGFTTLSASADILTTTIRTFGLATSESARVSNAFVATVNNSKTSIEGLRKSFGFSAITAAQFDLSVEELLTTLALLADKGLQPSTAATGFRGLLGALAKGSGNLREELAKVNLTLDDVNVKTKGFENVLKTLAKAQNPVTKEMLDINAAFKGFGLRVAPVVSELIKTSSGFGKFQKKVTGTTAAADGAAAAMATLANRIKLVLNVVENLKIEIGEELERSFKDLIVQVLELESQMKLVGVAIVSVTKFSADLLTNFLKFSGEGDAFIILLREMVGLFDLAAGGLLALSNGVFEAVDKWLLLAEVMNPFNDTIPEVRKRLSELNDTIFKAAATTQSMTETFDQQVAQMATSKAVYTGMSETLKLFQKEMGTTILTTSGMVNELSKLKNETELTSLSAEEYTGILGEQKTIGEEMTNVILRQGDAYKLIEEQLRAAGLSQEAINDLNLQEIKTVGELKATLEGLGKALGEVKIARDEASGDVQIKIDAETQAAKDKMEELRKEFEDQTVILARIGLEVDPKARERLVKVYEDTVASLEAKKVKVGLSIDEENKLKRFQARLREFEKEDETEIRVQIEADDLPAKKKVETLLKELRAKDAKISLSADDQKLLEQVNKFLTEIGDVKGTLNIDADTSKALDAANALIEEIERKQSEITIAANTVPLREELLQLKREVEAERIKVDADTKRAIDKIIEFEQRVLSGDPTAVIDAETKKALDKVNSLINIVEDADPTLDVDADITKAETAVDKLLAKLGKAREEFAQLGTRDDLFGASAPGESRASLEERGITIPAHLGAWDRFIITPDGRFLPLNADGSVALGTSGGHFASGGQVGPQGQKVPGSGNQDSVRTLASPGSFVLNKKATSLFDAANGRPATPIMTMPGERIFTPQQARNMGYGRLMDMNRASNQAELSQMFHRARGYADGGKVASNGSSAYGSSSTGTASTGTHIGSMSFNLSENTDISTYPRWELERLVEALLAGTQNNGRLSGAKYN